VRRARILGGKTTAVHGVGLAVKKAILSVALVCVGHPGSSEFARSTEIQNR